MSTRVARVRHLVRRFFGSLSAQPPPPADERWATDWLLPAEADLWQRMSNPDRRHAVVVARRFRVFAGDGASRAAMAGALLHDVGKVECGVGTFGRVGATLLGPRRSRGRWACYHRHEAIGAELCAASGSDPVTVAIVGDEPGGAGLPTALLDALHAADDI